MNNKKPVRVRFAPSPTGALHIGGVRTALYNYLFAKKHKGKFLLRIEDTDQKRYVPQATEYIMETFKWLGILPDEGYEIGGDCGPYKQSERLDIYKHYAEELLAKEKAYYAFDTPEALEKIRATYEAENKVFSYNAITRTGLDNSLNLSAEETHAKIKAGEPYVIRFKVEPNKQILLHDEIRGDIEIDTNTIDDKVLFKSDGFPTYHLANIVDDHLMEISHVIRGEEWLPSLAIHYLLYEAFQWEKPIFAHLPLLLKPEGKGKLSKRDAEEGGFPIFPLSWKLNSDTSIGYREAGFLPQATINLLVLLGWNPGTEKEIFEIDELIENFSLEQVNKSGARFNYDKAKFFNHEHLKNISPAVLLKELKKWADKEAIQKEDTYHEKVIENMWPRATFIHDIWTDGSFFYTPPIKFNEKDLKKAIKIGTAELLQSYVARLEKISSFEKEVLKKDLENFTQEENIGFGQIMQPLRLALCGNLSGPDLFAVIEMLGKEETIKRINYFQNNTTI